RESPEGLASHGGESFVRDRTGQSFRLVCCAVYRAGARRRCRPTARIPSRQITIRQPVAVPAHKELVGSDRVPLNAGTLHLADGDRAGIDRPDNAALCCDCACGDLLGRDRAVLDVRVANREHLTVLANVRLVLVGNMEPQVAFAHPLSRLIRLVEVLRARTVDDDAIKLLAQLVLHPLNLRLTVVIVRNPSTSSLIPNVRNRLAVDHLEPDVAVLERPIRVNLRLIRATPDRDLTVSSVLSSLTGQPRIRDLQVDRRDRQLLLDTIRRL